MKYSNAAALRRSPRSRQHPKLDGVLSGGASRAFDVFNGQGCWQVVAWLIMLAALILPSGCRQSTPVQGDAASEPAGETPVSSNDSSTTPSFDPVRQPDGAPLATPADAKPPLAQPAGDPAQTGGRSPSGTSAAADAAASGAQSPQLTSELLDRSLELGRTYLLNSQTDRGNFRYSYNLLNGELVGEDNQVRQAGALWGLALVHQARPTEETQRAVLRGLEFFGRCSISRADNTAFIEYPGDLEGETGTMALVCLAAIEYLRAAGDDPRADAVAKQLDRYFAFLLTLRRPDHQFYREYRWSSGAGIGTPSPYFDGESLLAMVKMARYRNRQDLQPMILESAEAIYQAYVERVRESDPDSDLTKALYQWATLAFLEIHEAGWDPQDVHARRAVELAHWMIDVHRTLERRRNAAYAHEGLAAAWYLAGKIGDRESQDKIAAVIDQAMYKFTTWQVGSPVANDFLRAHPDTAPLALGGVMSGADDPWLRIDTTQHQMHAVLLCREYLYP
jgi:hypothetical protein